jgi:glycosyltransferase involved in cell wall biosynthesis
VVAGGIRTPERKITVIELISPGGLYGAENVVLGISQKIDRDKFRSIIVCISDKRSRGIPLIEEAKKRHLENEMLFLKNRFDPSGPFKLKELFWQYNADIIHTHGYKADLMGLMASLCSNVNTMATVHGWTGADAKVRFYEGMDLLTLSRFQKVVAVSDEIRDRLKLRHPHLNVEVIPNGIDVDRFSCVSDASEIRSELGISPQAKVIGTVGRLSPEKGHRFLLDAFGEVTKSRSDVVLLIVGDGVLRRVLESHAERLGLREKVIFAGYRTDVDRCLAAMDIFVLPSLTEGLSISLLEAMCIGKPVIATAVGESPNMISNGSTGTLVQPARVSELSEAISTCLNNPGKGCKMAESARFEVKANYSWDRMAKLYESTYLSLVK